MDLDIIGIKYLNKIIKKLLNNKNINKEPLNKLIKYILINKQIGGTSTTFVRINNKSKKTFEIPNNLFDDCTNEDNIFNIQLNILEQLFNKINNDNTLNINKSEIDTIINYIILMINNTNTCKNIMYKDELPKIYNKLNNLNINFITEQQKLEYIDYTYDSNNNYFNNFNLLNNEYLITNNLYSINSKGLNSFVYKLLFINNNEKKKAYCLVKSASNNESDNLYYEYKVGLFLNQFINILPCFIETYNIYEYNDETSWYTTQLYLEYNSLYKYLYNNNEFNINLQIKDISGNELSNCDKINFSKYLCLTIEYINDSITLNSYLENNFNNSNFYNEIISIIFQIYSYLNCLGDNFTHYDLHTGNVLLYKPNKEKKYIKFVYIIDNEEIIFYSEYQVKIIDYGRCFYKGNDIFLNSIETNCSNIESLKIYYGKNLFFIKNQITPNTYNNYYDTRLFFYLIEKYSILKNEKNPITVNEVYIYIKLIIENIQYDNYSDYTEFKLNINEIKNNIYNIINNNV